MGTGEIAIGMRWYGACMPGLVVFCFPSYSAHLSLISFFLMFGITVRMLYICLI